MGIRENILAGRYDPPADHPREPFKPAVLKKAAGNLTEAELASLPGVRADYTALKARHAEQVAAFNRIHHERLNQFRADLLAEHGVPDGPFGREMYDLAYARGHAGGFDETVTAFEELLPLWELYRDKK